MQINVEGLVNFPINSSEYEDTSEECGTLVRLVIEPNDDETTSAILYGAGNYVIFDQSYVGDDKSEEDERERYEYNVTNIEDGLSIPYIAALTIGSTSWSGFDLKKKAYFVCRYDDLTEDGKFLYNALQKAFPHGKLVLQTWLDT